MPFCRAALQLLEPCRFSRTSSNLALHWVSTRMVFEPVSGPRTGVRSSSGQRSSELLRWPKRFLLRLRASGGLPNGRRSRFLTGAERGVRASRTTMGHRLARVQTRIQAAAVRVPHECSACTIASSMKCAGSIGSSTTSVANLPRRLNGSRQSARYRRSSLDQRPHGGEAAVHRNHLACHSRRSVA